MNTREIAKKLRSLANEIDQLESVRCCLCGHIYTEDNCPICNASEKEHPAIRGYNRYDYIPVYGIPNPSRSPAQSTGGEMKPRFETIDNTLCRMVEPEPLMPDSKMPCVVRLIQDDSPMGRNNDFYATSHLLAHIEIINGLDAIHFVGWQGIKTYYSRFEIIGYPVADGSAEWALWQAENGKSFEHKTAHHCRIFTMFSETEMKVTNEEGEVVEFVDIDRFLSDGAKDGWQLYEPKPESQYKVGDWVEHKESKEQATIRRIISYGAIEIEFAYSTESDIYEANDFHNDFRKLSPSEVVIHIGCLSGTIAKSSDPNYFLMLHSRPITDCNYSMIRFSAIDTQTRELVEGLLKAQDEEKQ